MGFLAVPAGLDGAAIALSAASRLPPSSGLWAYVWMDNGSDSRRLDWAGIGRRTADADADAASRAPGLFARSTRGYPKQFGRGLEVDAWTTSSSSKLRLIRSQSQAMRGGASDAMGSGADLMLVAEAGAGASWCCRHRSSLSQSPVRFLTISQSRAQALAMTGLAGPLRGQSARTVRRWLMPAIDTVSGDG
ncbi:hypothetical protein V8C44DRAFT_352046 [Trichoderma aethiopicum]